jgi:hypothetical protein
LVRRCAVWTIQKAAASSGSALSARAATADGLRCASEDGHIRRVEINDCFLRRVRPTQTSNRYKRERVGISGSVLELGRWNERAG